VVFLQKHDIGGFIHVDEGKKNRFQERIKNIVE